MATSGSRLDDALTARLFNQFKGNPARALQFLEGVRGFDQAALAQVARAGELETLAAQPLLIARIQADPILKHMIGAASELAEPAAAARIRGLLKVTGALPAIPESVARAEFFAKGGTSQIFGVEGRPDLLYKPAGGRLSAEAQALVDLELLGVPTIYGATREVGGQTVLIMPKVDGVSSKDIIGRVSDPKAAPENVDVVSARTIDDLEKIYRILQDNHANVGDFQFIVRRADGAVFVNDPVSFNVGRGPSGKIRDIIDRFKKIQRLKLSK